MRSVSELSSLTFKEAMSRQYAKGPTLEEDFLEPLFSGPHTASRTSPQRIFVTTLGDA